MIDQNLNESVEIISDKLIEKGESIGLVVRGIARFAIRIVLILMLLASSIAFANDDIISRKDRMVSAAKEVTSSISVNDLAALMENGESVEILDIRTQAEFDQGHIKGAQWVARGTLEFEASKGKLPPANARIVVYCKKDPRSSLAAKTLKELGFTDVTYLKGGVEDWVETGNSIYNMHGELLVKSFERSE